MNSVLRYFWLAFLVTGLGLVGAFALGWSDGGFPKAMSMLFIATVLAILEISLSFDNAVVNAKILNTMEPVWQQRFLTWGILIAVFGMRIVFPIFIVQIAASLGPIEALRLALAEPETYSRILNDAHVGIAAFGGTFLFMVGLNFFFDREKDVHWIGRLESAMAERLASVEGIAIAVVLVVMVSVSSLLPAEESATFMRAGVYGLLTFIAVDTFGALMERRRQMLESAGKAGFAAFLYLEVLDASFSFDGVIGAFALSDNLIIIAIGLGIGAMYVRSMTIMLVRKGTLAQYRYLEHGAFWAILFLAIIMYLQTLIHVPELITGLIGVVLIGLSIVSSMRWARSAGVSAADAVAH